MSNNIPYDIGFNSNSSNNQLNLSSSGSSFSGDISNAIIKYNVTDGTSVSSSASSLMETINNSFSSALQANTTNNLTTDTVFSLSNTSDSTTNTFGLSVTSDGVILSSGRNTTSSSTQSLLVISTDQVGLEYYSVTPSINGIIDIRFDAIEITCEGIPFLFSVDASAPSSLTDAGTPNEIRFDDTNGILYRCVTGSITAGSGKWNSYYSTTNTPLIIGTNNLPTNDSNVEFSFPDKSAIVIADGGQIGGNGTNGSWTMNGNSISMQHFIVNTDELNFSTTNSSYTFSDNGLSVSNNKFNLSLNNTEFNVNAGDSQLLLENQYVLNIANTAENSSINIQYIPSTIITTTSSGNNYSYNFQQVLGTPHYSLVYTDATSTTSNGITTYTLNKLASYEFTMTGAQSPILDLYVSSISSNNVIQSVQNSDGTYTPYVTGFKTDTNGILGIYDNSTKPIINVSSFVNILPTTITSGNALIIGEQPANHSAVIGAYVDTSYNNNIIEIMSGSNELFTMLPNGNIETQAITASGGINTDTLVCNDKFTIPSCTFANLPTNTNIGMQFLVTDGCKPGEASGSGTGVLCVYDGHSWMNVSSGTTVTI